MITETQVRDALHDAAAAVEVDEDLAWQRAWIEVARQPMFLVCVSDQVKRLGAAKERKPNKSESSAARKSRAV